VRLLYLGKSDLECLEMREKYDITVTPVADPHAAVEDADIVGTAGSTAHLKEEWQKAGARDRSGTRHVHPRRHPR